MKILISWLAYHEDFRLEENGLGFEVNENGPNSAFHRDFFSHDKHLLLYTSKTIRTRAEHLANFLRLKYKDRQIELVEMDIDDPINVEEIKGKVLKLLAELKDHQIESYISPGTPAMQVAWYLLHLNNVLNLKIFQTREAKFTKNKKPELIGVQLNESATPYTALLYQEKISNDSDNDYLITKTKKFVYDNAKLVAQTPNVTVLIKGESGTGKEKIAKHIHDSSGRAGQQYIPINCAALGDQLLESRLFGYVKGAFTGADKDTPGLFERAHKGTVFLDEIGDISPYLQQALLRVLQEKQVMPVGGGRLVNVDVRVISATNRNLVQMCKEGLFRWDLFYRLAVVELELPQVKDYPKNEVKELLNHFIKKIAVDLKKTKLLKPNKEALEIMVDYPYPGNIREMENIISRLYVFKEGEIGVKDLPSFMLGQSRLKSWKIEEVEKQHITKALSHFEGNQRQTAIALGVTVNTLKAKMKKHDI